MRVVIIAAFKQEVEQFIVKVNLYRSQTIPFSVYSGDKYNLIISGPGKVNAAAALTYICRDEPELVINAGTAGALKPLIREDDVFAVTEIFESDRPLFCGGKRVAKIDNITRLNGAVCLCRDMPAITDSERDFFSADADITDMESAAVLQVCRLFKVQCGIIKIISDGAGCSDKDEIVKKIAEKSGKLYRVVAEFLRQIEN